MHEPTLITLGSRPLRWAASMRLTQVLLGMLAVATLAAYLADGIGALTLGIPLGLYAGLKPDSGQVFLSDEDITALPMYQRARAGIGYLPQEASIFRRLTGI